MIHVMFYFVLGISVAVVMGLIAEDIRIRSAYNPMFVIVSSFAAGFFVAGLVLIDWQIYSLPIVGTLGLPIGFSLGFALVSGVNIKWYYLGLKSRRLYETDNKKLAIEFLRVVNVLDFVNNDPEGFEKGTISNRAIKMFYGATRKDNAARSEFYMVYKQMREDSDTYRSVKANAVQQYLKEEELPSDEIDMVCKKFYLSPHYYREWVNYHQSKPRFGQSKTPFG